VPVADRAVCEPYAAIQHGACLAPGELGLPQPFRAMLLPALRGLDRATVRDYLAVYWALCLDRRPALLLSAAQLARRQPTRNTLDWCRHIARQPDEHRPAIANLLLATGAGEVEASRLTPQALEAFTALTAPALYAYRLCCLFRALRQGVAIDYL